MPATNWYLIFTRPSWEKKVVDNLFKKRIEYYFPYNKIVNIPGKSQVLYKPLFTSYVFVRISALRLGEIKKIDGVVNLVYWLDKPAIIRDIEIEMMRRFLNEHINIQLERTIVNEHEMVRITTGTFQEEDGNEIDVSSKCVKLVLPSLGYSLVTEVTEVNSLEVNKINTENVEVQLESDPIHYDSSSMENSLNYGL